MFHRVLHTHLKAYMEHVFLSNLDLTPVLTKVNLAEFGQPKTAQIRPVESLIKNKKKR